MSCRWPISAAASAWPASAQTPDTRIVVVEVEIDDDPVTLGLVADKVFEVTEISAANSQQTPRLGSHWKPEFIRFITKWNDEFVIVPELAQDPGMRPGAVTT